MCEQRTLEQPYPESIKSIKGTWKELYRTISKLLVPLIRQIQSEQWSTKRTPYTARSASVRKASTGLSDPENVWQALRDDHTIRTLKKRLHASDDDTYPRIALCFSGGGLRSTLLTLGFLLAAEDSGLLDATSYISSLSGSSWAHLGWIASQKSLSSFTQSFAQNLDTGLSALINDDEFAQHLADRLFTKLHHGQMITAIDFYGALMTTLLLGDSYHRTMTLSSTHITTHTGSMPLPLYTIIAANHFPYQWLEINPFEVTAPQCDAAIPLNSFGHAFDNGITTTPLPEPSIDEIVGIMGSAFSVNAYDLIRHSLNLFLNLEATIPPDSLPVWRTALDKIITTYLGSTRPLSALIPNFMHGMSTACYPEARMLELADAGIDFNLPIIPLLHPERKVNLIIIYDSSMNINGAPELREAEHYARRHGYPFPPIDYHDIGNRPVSVFEDITNPACPTIIYMPRIANKRFNKHFDPDDCIINGFCSTLNIDYHYGQLYTLMGLSKFTLTEVMPAIWLEIEKVFKKLNHKYEQDEL